MSLPHYLTRTNILDGIRYIDEHEVPKRRRVKKYAVKWKGKEYPPKWLICVAHISYDGNKFEGVFGGGSQANNFLIFREFKVWNKETETWVGPEPAIEDDSKVFEEGKKAYRRHVSYERDSKVAKLAKKKRISEAHELRCDVCDFCFNEAYGSLGMEFIEAHHTIPVAKMHKKGKKDTKISDIALVCSNCHRMIHRYVPWLSISQLRKILLPKPVKA